MSADWTTTPNPTLAAMGPMFDRFAAQNREILARISHELRTPLASILPLVHILLEDAAHGADGGSGTLTPTERVEFLRTIQEEAERLTRSIQYLLARGPSDASVGGGA